MQRDGIVEEELRSVLENNWETVPGEVPMEGARDIGGHEGGVAGQGFGEDGREIGECIVGADRKVRDGAISDDENSSDGINVVLDLSGDTPLVEAVLLDTPSVGQARCVQDANLGGRSHISACSKTARTYHYAVVTHKFIKIGRVGPALVGTITLLIGVAEGVEVIGTNALANQDISDEF